MAIFVVVTIYIFLFGYLFSTNIDSISKRVLLSYWGIWLLAIIVSVSSPYGLNKANDDTIYIILAHVVMFAMGFIIARRNNKYVVLSFNEKEFQYTVDKIIKSKLFLGILVLSFIYIIYLFGIFYQAILLSNTVGEVRHEYYSEELLGSDYTLINSLFLVPFNMLLLALFCYMVIYKRNVICWMIGLEYFLYSSLSGARGGFLDIIIGVFFVLFCLGNVGIRKNRGSVKKIVQTILIFSFVLVLVSWLTSIRSEGLEFNKDSIQRGSKDLVIHVTSYLGGPIVAFDYAINSNYVEKVGGYQYGQMTFASFEEFFFYTRSAINKLIPIGLYERSISRIGSLMQETIDIGAQFLWNALYTSCMYYYLDFGIWGVIILPFFLGYLIRKILLFFYNHNPFYIYIVCSFVFIIMIDSITRLYFYRFSQLLFVIIALYLSKKRRYSLQL